MQRSVRVAGKAIHEITGMSIAEAQKFLSNINLSGQKAVVADRILREINERLGFLDNVGLSYLTLDRAATTLSGGGKPANTAGHPDRIETHRCIIRSG